MGWVNRQPPHPTADYIHGSKSFKKLTQFWKVRNVRLHGIKYHTTNSSYVPELHNNSLSRC